jgi:thioredoxin 1
MSQIMSKPIHVSDAEFEEKVLKSDVPVIVDFWAAWCPPCRMIAPILDDLASEYDGKIVVAKVNTDEDQQYAIKYGVQSIPTVLFVRNGELIDRMVGAAPKHVFKARIENVLTPVSE